VFDDKNLIDYLYDICNRSDGDLLICGDFNCPEIQWTPAGSQIGNHPLVDWCMDNFLTQHVMTATRPGSNSVLDLVFTSDSTTVSRLIVSERFGTSDHAVVSFDLSLPLDVPLDDSNSKLYLFTRAKWKDFRADLLNSRWPSDQSLNINQHWEKFLANIKHAMKAAIPIGKKSSWSLTNSKKVKTALRHLRRLHKKYQLEPTFDNQLRLLCSQSALVKAVKVSVVAHEKKIAASSADNPKRFWSYVNAKLKTKTNITAMVSSTGETIHDPKSIANSFNNVFCSNFCKYCPPFDKPALAPRFTISDVNFTQTIVYTFVRKLPASSSCDMDGLCYLILKKGGMYLAAKLAFLFNRLLKEGAIPDSWRRVMVTPIFKAGPRNQFANYRPVAISSCISRLMERIVVSAIMRFSVDNQLLIPSQHGFRPGFSTETAGIEFLDFITKTLDQRLCVDIAFLDYSRAFDTVPHNILCSKLHRYGISGNLLSWISDFLAERRQVVRIIETLSDTKNIASGVIQGSVLGPLLFLIYTNDLDQTIDFSRIIKYADDIKLFQAFPCHDKDTASKLQHDLNKIELWSTQNGLSLNTNKTKIMNFGNRNPCNSYSIGNTPLERVDVFKDLGILISSPYGFKQHIFHMCSRANRTLGMILKSFSIRDSDVLTKIFKAHVRSILEFGSILWNPYHVYATKHIERIQRRFTKAFRDIRLLPYRERLKLLGLFSLSARRLRYRLIFIFKMFKGSDEFQ
jgi:hypothetical protein